MIPGSNLLNRALRLIGSQSAEYRQYTGRTTNAIGYDISTYADPVTIYGSMQPVPRTLYEQYGLDFQKKYYTFYTSTDVRDVARGVSGDSITFSNEEYACESNNDWYVIDGWKGILCVKQKPSS